VTAASTFSPNLTKVSRGTQVVWTWNTGGEYGVDHNVTFPTGGSSPTQNTGTFSRVFDVVGDFTYTCTLHEGMSGTIVVR
jgi:plastocyanin